MVYLIFVIIITFTSIGLFLTHNQNIFLINIELLTFLTILLTFVSIILYIYCTKKAVNKFQKEISLYSNKMKIFGEKMDTFILDNNVFSNNILQSNDNVIVKQIIYQKLLTLSYSLTESFRLINQKVRKLENVILMNLSEAYTTKSLKYIENYCTERDSQFTVLKFTDLIKKLNSYITQTSESTVNLNRILSSVKIRGGVQKIHPQILPKINLEEMRTLYDIINNATNKYLDIFISYPITETLQEIEFEIERMEVFTKKGIEIDKKIEFSQDEMEEIVNLSLTLI